MRRLRTASIVTVAVVLGLGAPDVALGHAELRSSSPFADAILDRAPNHVVLAFTEPLEESLTQVRVYGSDSRRFDSGSPAFRGRSELRQPLASLRAGTYTVVWRALTRDGHVSDGGFVFHIGGPGGRVATAAEEFLALEAPWAVREGHALTRFLNLALVLLVVGGAAAIAFVLHDASEGTLRSLYLALAFCAFLLAVAALAAFLLQGIIAARPPLTPRVTVFSSMLETLFGQASIARAGLALAIGGVALLAGRATAERRLSVTDDVLIALAVLLTFTLPTSGHASVRGPLAYFADAGHVAAAAAWIGGLSFTSLAVVWSRSDRPNVITTLLSRFSVMALAAVVLLGVTAVGNAYSHVGSVDALWRTDYGQLILVKGGLLLPLLALGYLNRRQLARRGGGNGADDARRTFLRVALVELVIMALIVSVTASLVDAIPPSTAATRRP